MLCCQAVWPVLFQIQVSYVDSGWSCQPPGPAVACQKPAVLLSLDLSFRFFVFDDRVRSDCIISDVWLPNWESAMIPLTMTSGHVVCTFGQQSCLYLCGIVFILPLGNFLGTHSCVDTFPWCKSALALHYVFHQLYLKLGILHTSCDGLCPCNMFLYQLGGFRLGLALKPRL